MSERCKRTSERRSEWPSTLRVDVYHFKPLCDVVKATDCGYGKLALSINEATDGGHAELALFLNQIRALGRGRLLSLSMMLQEVGLWNLLSTSIRLTGCEHEELG